MLPKPIVRLEDYFDPNGDVGTTTIKYKDGSGNSIDTDTDISDPSTLDLSSDVSLLAAWLLDVLDKFLDSLLRSSPLILDLDGDGLELTALSSNSVTYFDFDGDGFASQTGWVAPDDGILVLDSNGDGEIDSAELFGSMTTDGFTALAPFDSNGNGKVDAEDQVWTDLIIWKDANADGYLQSSEAHDMGDFNMLSIDLAGVTEVSQTLQGHAITHASTYSYSTGSGTATRAIKDVWFTHNSTNTRFIGEYDVDQTSWSLPNLKGYGILADLNVAMSMDKEGSSSLQAQVLNFFSYVEFDEIFDATSAIPDLVKSILFRWAGVDGVSSTARGAFVDGRELGFLEKLVGEPFLQRGIYSNPYGKDAGYDLQEAFRIAYNNMYGRLLAQSAGEELFTGTPVYNIATDKFEGITGLNSTKLSDLQSEAAALSTSAARHTFWGNVVRMVDFVIDLDSSTYSAAKSALASAIDGSDSSDATVILGSDTPGAETGIRNDIAYDRPASKPQDGGSGNDTLNGTTGDDDLDGWGGNDTLNGLSGNDRLYGSGGNDTLNGGLGGDYLQGYSDDDRYIYARGDGDDTIEDRTNTINADTIEFQAGISLAHLTLTRMGNQDLAIDIAGGGRIVVLDQFVGYGVIETLSFADGSPAWNILAHSYEVRGTEGKDTIDGVASYNGGLQDETIHGGGGDKIESLNGDDTIYGDAGNDTLEGYNGNDKLYGGHGNDTIYGEANNDEFWDGAGDDKAYGGPGNDTYHYESGHDYYYDSAGTDAIVLDARWDAVAPRYQFVKSADGNSNNLLIWFDDRNTIQIEDWTSSAPYIETMTFANGTSVNLATVSPVGLSTVANSSANTIAGTTGADVIYGYGGNDTLNGTGTDGADNLYGGTGDDTLKGGNGDDWLQGDAGNDVLQGGADNDTYFFTGGLDEITEGGGSSDTLKLLAGPTLESITLSDSGNNRTVVVGTGVNEIKIVDHLNASDTAKRIEYLALGDGFRINLVGATPWTSVTGNNSWTGTTGADSAVAGSGNNNLSGGDGDDMLHGGAGADYVTGGAGADTLHGGSGDDPSVRGGDGDDLLWGGDGNDVLDGENDNDTLYGGAGVNRLEGGDGDDILWGGDAGTAAAPEQLRGEAGRDTIHGGNGVDETLGGGGDDTIYGNGGDDELFGGSGDDAIHGGTGNDLIRGEEGRDDLYGDEGNDDVRGGLDDNIVHGGDGDDVLWGGYNASDAFYGNDTLYGDAGSDTLNGALGDDTLDGGAGNDSMYGAGGQRQLRLQRRGRLHPGYGRHHGSPGAGRGPRSERCILPGRSQ